MKYEFQKGVAFEIEKGNRVSFWNDIWCGETTLREDFLGIYLRSRDKEGLVVNHLKWEDHIYSWNLKIRARVYDWETEEIENLMQRLQQVHPSKTEEDKMRWTLSNTGEYTVKSMCELIALAEGVENYPTKLVWEIEMPYKV
ncbi:Reverse transcriptase zinc-binding domain [Thalictrum thalictroides]|uniref:Reverse transcriptase zinc-binding domain n=1 Tax=Thalictrum thalictroides TaxID=46969 RepID=A0A7J6UYL5_THATH|nr:Reverse transcriptase zinc-binding domain [Thalictrum thalictroides]